MEKWSEEEMQEYEDYLDSLTMEEVEDELMFIQMIGKAKTEGKNIVYNESQYVC